jgi:hypothetical protein
MVLMKIGSQKLFDIQCENIDFELMQKRVTRELNFDDSIMSLTVIITILIMIKFK